MTKLPTRDEMLANAARELDNALGSLEEAASWLRSDWAPVGSALTSAQADRRKAYRKAITEARRAIEAGRLA